jgi:hypothetical protein
MEAPTGNKKENEKEKEDNDISFSKNKAVMPDEKSALKKDDPNDLNYRYKNFKWKDPEKLKNGPISDENRKCRDCICCIIFLVFMVACIIIGLLGFFMGKPQKILFPYDEDGNACGYDEGYEEYKVLYFYDVLENLENFEVSKIVNAFCVKECPKKKYDKNEYKNKNITLDCKGTKNNQNCTVTFKNYYRSVNLLGRFCFPNNTDEEEFDPNTQQKVAVYDFSKKVNIERIVDKGAIKKIDGEEYVKANALKAEDDSKVASEKLINFSYFNTDRLIYWISDIVVARYVILASLIWSFVIAMIFLLFLRCCAGIIVFLILVGIFAGLVILSIILRFKMNDYADEGDEKNKILFCVLFWVCAAASLIWLLFVLIMCNRIRLSVALIQIAAKYINTNCSILLIPFLFFIITIAWFVYWVVMSVYLYSTGDFDQENSKIFASFKWKYEIRYLWWVHLFSLFYISALISAFSQFIYASSASIWYFNYDKGTEGHMILKSFKRAFRYNFGSLCFGALIIAIVRFIMFIFERFKKRLSKTLGKKTSSKIYKCVLCCIECFLRCITRVLEFINKQAYIMISIKGDNFCKAAWEGFALTVRNLGRFSILTLLGKLFSTIGTLFISVSSGIIGYLVIQNYGFLKEEINSSFLPVFCMVLIGLIIGLVSMDVFGMSADTLLFCFLIDEEINKGQPKAMPELQKFMSEER